MDELLGKQSDNDLAVKFGATNSVVAYRRKILGIAPFARIEEKDPEFNP